MSGPVRRHELESLDGIEPVSFGKPGRGLFRISVLRGEYGSLAGAAELLALVGREAIRALPRVAIGLGQPVADGLGGRLELLRERFRRAPLRTTSMIRCRNSGGTAVGSSASWTPPP